MSKNNGVSVETRTFVDGVNVADLSVQELTFKIKSLKAEIQGLKDLGVESKNIAALIEKHEASIVDLVAVIDSKSL